MVALPGAISWAAGSARPAHFMRLNSACAGLVNMRGRSDEGPGNPSARRRLARWWLGDLSAPPGRNRDGIYTRNRCIPPEVERQVLKLRVVDLGERHRRVTHRSAGVAAGIGRGRGSEQDATGGA